MRISGYIKSKTMILVAFLATTAALVLLLWVVGLDTRIIGAVCVMLFVAFAGALAWDYATRRRFYRDLYLAIDAAKNTNYITEYLRRPIFTEGQLTYDALELATKNMNDKIAGYRIAADEYRDYIETWIHEVKTPIAATRLILNNNPDVENVLIAHELDRIEAHVEQALFYARSTAVEKDYIIKNIKLEDAVKNCVKKHSRLLIDTHITPKFEGLDVLVYADPKWLDFVLGQLIINSVKYCRPRSEGFTPQIVFTAERIELAFESARVRLHVRDNGIGIPAADITRVFEKGFTGENGRAFAKSTGIGLYLCKKLCEKMKLGISVVSLAEAESAQAAGEFYGGITLAGSANDTGGSSDAVGTTLTIDFPLNKMYFLE